MKTPERTKRPEIEAFKAQLAALEGKSEEALAQLADKHDDESLLSRMTILMDGERFEDAAAIVRGKTPDERFCEKAVGALAAAGSIDEAKTWVQWASQRRDSVLWFSSLIALARNRYLHVFQNWSKDKPNLPGELSAEEREAVRQSLNDLAPIVNTVKAQQRLITGVEATAVALAMEFCYVLGERQEYRELSELVWKRKPLPLNYALAVTRKVIPPEPELPRRLREEQKDSFEAKRLAAFIEGTLLVMPQEAIRATEEMLREYGSPNQQQQLAHLLLQLAAELPQDERKEVQTRADALLSHDSRYAKFREVEDLLKENRFDEAENCLVQLTDQTDATWLEFMSAVRKGQGKHGESVDLLIQATQRFPDPDLLRKASLLAAQNDRKADAIKLLERLLRAEPEDMRAREHLAFHLMQAGNYDKAAEQFRELRKLCPTDPAPTVNEAVCLALSLRYDESLQVYESLSAGDPPPLRAVLGQAALLKALNRASDGFAVLERRKSSFWDHPDFLKAYVDLGYAAKREEEAGHGFLRLRQLQAEGKIQDVVHEVELPELVKLIRQQNQNQETINGEIVRGRFPWLLAAEMMNTPMMVAFRERTCPVSWLPDDPASWSRHNLYATNGYLVAPSETGSQWLEPIRAPDRETEIVVDLSALIILHRLNLLSVTAQYFGKCYYPSAYGVSSLMDRNRLVVHQPSRLEAALQIKSTIDSGRIRVLQSGNQMAFVHEHCPENENTQGPSYGFKDLLLGVEEGQLLSDTKVQELTNLAHRPSSVGSERQRLAMNDPIRVHLSSLETLQQHGLLAAILSCFQVHITDADRDQLLADIRAWQERQAQFNQHDSLWRELRENPRFEAIAHSVPIPFSKANEQDVEGTDNKRTYTALFAAFVAQEKTLPLLVDDRACQMLVHNNLRTATAAFATESLIRALLRCELISLDTAADAYMQLVGWRYRFMIVPAKVMVALAKRNLRTPPGRALQQVARYVQDNMRDPGLFGGLEPVKPPLAIAHKLFLGWTGEVTDFVLSLWDDPAISTDTARAFTEWALTECLPSLPQSPSVNPPGLAMQLTRHVLTQAFIHAASRQNAERVNAALVAIASILGFTDREYYDEMVEVIDEI